MYELVIAGSDAYYIESPSKMGLIVRDGKAVLIDTGNGKDAAKKALSHIAEQNWELCFILNTHHHADHCGGNALLQARTNVSAYAKGLCATFCEQPELGVSMIYGGLPPRTFLQNRMVAAEKSVVQDLLKAPLDGLTVVPLDGHCPDMFGVLTEGGVFFCADAVSGEHVLQKYHVTLLYDVKAQFETLSMLENMAANLFVPSHAPATEDIRPLVRKNRAKTEEVANLVLRLAKGGHSLGEVLQGVIAHYNIWQNAYQYALVRTTVQSYLTYLFDEGQLGLDVENGRVVYR